MTAIRLAQEQSQQGRAPVQQQPIDAGQQGQRVVHPSSQQPPIAQSHVSTSSNAASKYYDALLWILSATYVL